MALYSDTYSDTYWLKPGSLAVAKEMSQMVRQCQSDIDSHIANIKLC